MELRRWGLALLAPTPIVPPDESNGPGWFQSYLGLSFSFQQDLSYEFAGTDDLGIFWNYDLAADGAVSLDKQSETISHYSPDGNEPFFSYEIKADAPSFPRLNAPYNVRLG